MDEVDKMMQGIASGKLNLAHTLTHKEFVAGIRNNTLTYTIIGEESDFLEKNGAYKKTFNFLVAFYWLSPLVVIPICVFFIGNWWLLFGILFSYFGSFTAQLNLTIYPVLFCIGQAIFGHWHFKDYDDFFILCMFWGYLWFRMADQSQKDYADFDLMSKPELYNLAVEKNRILVSKKIDIPK